MSIQFSNFKNTIKDFLKLDEEIRALSKAKLDRTKLRNKLSNDIMIFYKNNNISTLDINVNEKKEYLKLVETNRMPSVNQKFLREALNKHCGNESVVDKMIEGILNERKNHTTLQFKLKRTNISKNKKDFDINNVSSNVIAENDKIKDRFNKLAEYAIVKGGLTSCDDEEEEDNIKMLEQLNANLNINLNKSNKNETHETNENNDNLDLNHNQNNQNNDNPSSNSKSNVKEVKKLLYGEEYKYFDEECDTDEDETEDIVNLEDIPLEDTGYEDEPPRIEDNKNKKENFKNLLANKLDNLDNQNEKDIGCIPRPNNVSSNNNSNYTLNELEEKALTSWKLLDETTKDNPIIAKWLAIQKEKLKIFKAREQFSKDKFETLWTNIKNIEKENDIKKNKYSTNINNSINIISKYIDIRCKLSI